MTGIKKINLISAVLVSLSLCGGCTLEKAGNSSQDQTVQEDNKTEQVKAEKAENFFMIDQYGRMIDYLRISLTSRCNLRCIYCMPEEGIRQIPRTELLDTDEIVRICKAASELGISRIKLTGGEPLVRRICTLSLIHI